jgi:predicted transcriptional regulator
MMKDWRTGKYTQKRLAKKYDISEATVSKYLRYTPTKTK